MFIDIAGKPMCLICGANMAVIKEFNLRRHLKTKHQDKLKKPEFRAEATESRRVKEESDISADVFTRAKTQSEAVVKASFIVAEEITKSGRPFTQGEFLKNRMLKV